MRSIDQTGILIHGGTNMSPNRFANSILTTFSNDMADVVDILAKNTVMVNARKRLPTSGLLVQPDQVLTVDHGVEKEEGIELLIADVGLVSGKLVGRDPGTDLALIRVDREVPHFEQIAQASARVGMPSIMVGRPEPEGHQASFGIVTAVGGGLRTMKGSILDHYVATDATPYPGFSGGPLSSLDGSIIGINTSGLVGGLSLAIPISLAMSVAGQLVNFGRVKRGFLGIRSQKVDLQDSLRKTNPTIPLTGLLVVGLEGDGPASLSGILVGDILVEAGGVKLTNHDDLIVMLAGDVAGKEVPFEIVRGGELKRIPVTVGER
jgi:S1-C subfamily serine protease